MQKMNQLKYSIWLLPSKEDKAYLSEVIQSFGAEYDAPVFDPHCTIFSPISDLDSAKAIIDQINFKPFEVPMTVLGQTDIIWKTVFIELQKKNQLTILNQIFKESFDVEYNFQPHISLIYKTMESDSKNAIIQKLDLKKSYIMDGIGIVETSGPVEEWKSVYEVNFNRD